MALQLNTSQDGGCHRTWRWAPGHGHQRRSILEEQIRKLHGREQTAGERSDWQPSASTQRPGFSVRGKQTSLISNEDSADSRGPPRKPGSPTSHATHTAEAKRWEEEVWVGLSKWCYKTTRWHLVANGTLGSSWDPMVFFEFGAHLFMMFIGGGHQ